MLPQLGTAAGVVVEVRKQMVEHRAYCGAIIWELQRAMVVGITCSAGAGSSRVQSAADGAGSASGVTAEIQRLQEDLCSVQKAMGSAKAKTRRVEMDGNTEMQRLHAGVCGEPVG